MNDYQMTTGKEFKAATYACKACSNVYEENKTHMCPACGSDQRKPYQQTTATLPKKENEDAS